MQTALQLIVDIINLLTMAQDESKNNDDIHCIAVVQMTSTTDVDYNFKTISNLMEKICKYPVEMVFLPEAFAFIGDGKIKSKDIADTSIDPIGPLLKKYVSLAVKYDKWLSLGGFPILNKKKDKVSNTHIIVNNKGDIIESYDKIHLFDVDIPNGMTIKESNWTIPGDKIKICSSPIGCLGLTVCYDLRFPGLYSSLRRMGANILLVPSAFSVETGYAHWDVLLRTRAIENQCYVVAAAQIGKHNDKRKTYGYSVIIDPWGTIISKASPKSSPSFIIAEIDLDIVRKVRQSMPISLHEKPNLYK